MTATERPLYDYLRFEASLCATYYKEGSDLDRERNWVLRARKQREIFRNSGLAERYPELAAEFRLREYYHAAQSVCCDPSCGAAARRARLKLLAERARREDGGGGSGTGGLFWFFLLHCLPLLPLLCHAKRKKDAFGRRRRRNTGKVQ